MDTFIRIKVESKITLDLERDLFRVIYWKHILITIIVFVVCTPLLFYLSLHDYRKNGNSFSLAPVIFVCVMFFFLMYLFCGYACQPNRPIHRLSVIFSFSENGYTTQDINDSITFLFKNVIEVFETRRAFYLRVGPKRYNVVTKTGFIEGNSKELYDLLSRHFKIQKLLI